MKYGVGNVKVYHSFSLVLLVFFVLQVLSGFFLVSLISLDLGNAFYHLFFLIQHCWYVWLLRDFHMLCANFTMFVLYIHLGKALSLSLPSFSRVGTWLTGSALFVLSLGICFTGYILVGGQMSYWALIVILNLLTVIPVVDDVIVGTLLAGSYPSSASLQRIMSLHFLLALVGILLMLIHLSFVHRSTPSSVQHVSDASSTLADVVFKDLLYILPLIGVYTLACSSLLIHPDNYQTYDSIATPSHIEPETYFLWLFCILKSRTSKLAGVLSPSL